MLSDLAPPNRPTSPAQGELDGAESYVKIVVTSDVDPEQVSLLIFVTIASKGAACVARATLAGRSPFDELSLEPDVHGAPTNAPEADDALPDPQTTVAEGQAKAAVVS